MNKKQFSRHSMVFIIITIAVASFIGGAALSSFQLGSSPSPAGQPVPSQMDNRITALEAAVKKAPDTPAAWIELGNAYFDSDQYQASIDAYARGLALDPLNANALTDMGVMYRRSGQPQKAVDAFNRAIAADPKHETARMNKGIVLINDLNDTRGAVAAWEGLLEINPFFMVGGGKSLKEVVASYK
ncbi:MAG: tetratricopeptide repeat protein [Desulfobacter sp.]|nr:MAG: tetratricopeptide repeat protein [Desulfobacter sp.]